MRRRRLRVLLVGIAAGGLAGAAAAQAGRAAEGSGRVEGRVMLGIAGARLADVGPVVVYLEPAEGAAVPAPVSPRPAGRLPTIRQRNAHFAPGFLAIAAGQAVEMPNDDAIYHNVFSYSKGNAFDLGLYAAGTSRQVRFQKPGPIKIYCSIHESMNATVFASPTPWFAVAASDGSFALPEVPAGAWRLRTWCERLPDTTRALEVEAGGVVRLEIPLVAPAGER